MKSAIIHTSIRAKSHSKRISTTRTRKSTKRSKTEKHSSSSRSAPKSTERLFSRSIHPTVCISNKIDLESSKLDSTNDLHRHRKNKITKKHLAICIASSVIAAIILITIAVGIPLVVLLKSESKTTTTATLSSTTKPIENPCTTRVFWDTTGIIYAGGNLTGSVNALNRLNNPTGISMDSNDNLYISDSVNYRVVKYLPGASSGILVAGIGSPGNSLNQFSSSIRFTYVDSNENLYISDNGNHRVVRWANGASIGSIVAGNGTSGTSLNQVNGPYSVWVDSNSNIFVAEFQNNRVTKWSPGATAGVIVAGGNGSGITPDKLYWPSGLSYNETNQDLYITNSYTNSNSVIKWHVGAVNGTVVGGTLGSSGSLSTQLSWPLGITLDRWNNIYVADRSNYRIQLFCSGNLTGITIAGNAIGGRSLSLPYGVALDSQLNLYVSDFSSSQVYKFNKL